MTRQRARVVRFPSPGPTPAETAVAAWAWIWSLAVAAWVWHAKGLEPGVREVVVPVFFPGFPMALGLLLRRRRRPRPPS